MKSLCIALMLGAAPMAWAQDPAPPSDSWRPTQSTPPPATVDAETAALDEREHPGPECRRQLGGSVGMVFPTDDWDLLGVSQFTGSPVLSLVCNLGGLIRPLAGLTTAPFQAHWYRDLGQAGLYVMPHFGVTVGSGPFRFSAYTVMMPRLIGAGVSAELRFNDGEGSWLTHTSKGSGKGFELRLQVLDGDLVQYQAALLYTFGVNRP